MAGGVLKRSLYLALAGLFFALAVAGVVLPILPTTPFLLLCSYFLARSSPRLQRALQRSRVFGPFLRDWHDRGGVRRSVKIWAIVCVTGVVGATVWFGGLPDWARGVLVGLAAIGITVVVRLPAARNEEPVPSPVREDELQTLTVDGDPA